MRGRNPRESTHLRKKQSDMFCIRWTPWSPLRDWKCTKTGQEAQFWTSSPTREDWLSFVVLGKSVNALVNRCQLKRRMPSWGWRALAEGTVCLVVEKAAPEVPGLHCQLVKMLQRRSIRETLQWFLTPSCCNSLSPELRAALNTHGLELCEQAQDEVLSRDLCLNSTQPLSPHLLGKDSLSFPVAPFL